MDKPKPQKAAKGKVPPQNKVTKTTPGPSGPNDESIPLHADRVWNKVRPGKKAKSTIAKFNDGGEKSYPAKPHFAPGVPNNVNIKRGYFSAGARPGKGRGGSGDVDDGSYPPSGAHTTY